MEFKDRFREIRKSKGFTQQQLADMLFLTKMAISHWEKGNSEPSIYQLKTLAHYFNISIDDLVGYDEDDTKQEETMPLAN